MAAQHHKHINPNHGKQDRAAQPLYQGYRSQHPLIEGQGAHAAPGKCHRHEVSRHEQPHEFQYLIQHLGRHLEAGRKAGGQAGKQQKVGHEKTCIGYLPAFKNRRHVGKHGPDDSDCSHLEQHVTAFSHLGEQGIPDTCPHLSQNPAQIAFHQLFHQVPEGEIPHASPMLSHDLIQELLHPFHFLLDSKLLCPTHQLLF